MDAMTTTTAEAAPAAAPAASTAVSPSDIIGAELEAARVRLSAAEKWAEASAKLLERAQAQVAASQKELREARDYVRGLELQGKDIDVDANDDNADADDIQLMSSLSGEAGNEGADKKTAVTSPSEDDSGDEVRVMSSTSTVDTENETVSEAAAITSSIESKGTIDDDESARALSITAASNDTDVETTAKEEAAEAVKATSSSETDRTPVATGGAAIAAVSESESSGARSVESASSGASSEHDDVTERNEGKGCEEETNSFDELLHVLHKKDMDDEEDVVDASKNNDEAEDEHKSKGGAFVSHSSQLVDRTPDRVVDCKEIEVKGCGVPEIAGTYHRFEVRDGVPAYSKIASYEGKEVMFTIGRWQAINGTRKWYITAQFDEPGGGLKRLAFYVAYSPSSLSHPPRNGWLAVTQSTELFLSPAYEGRGVRPAPAIVLESDVISRMRDRFGSQISAALNTASSRHISSVGSSKKRRGNGNGSIPSIGSVSTQDYTSTTSIHENIPSSVHLPPSLLEVKGGYVISHCVNG